MFVYLVLPLLAGILNGLTEIFNKSITEKKYSTASYSFLQWCGNLIFYSFPFFLSGESLPTNPKAYIPLVVITLIVFAGNLFLIKAYKTEDASNVNIISRISLIVSFLNGIILLSEPINFFKITGALFIFTGIMVIFYQGKKLKLSAGLLLALFSGICFGMMAFLNKLGLPYFPSGAAYLFTANLLATAIFLLKPSTLKDVKPILKKYLFKYILSRITSATGYLIFVFALVKADISVVNTNFETAFLLSVVVIGIIFLRERKDLKKKIIGALFCSAGIILLNFF